MIAAFREVKQNVLFTFPSVYVYDSLIGKKIKKPWHGVAEPCIRCDGTELYFDYAIDGEREEVV